MGTQRENDVVLTSMRRDDVAATLIQRHFGTKCPLGSFWHTIKHRMELHSRSSTLFAQNCLSEST